MRRVLAHVHLFKNAGTSVERGLKACFGKNWGSVDTLRSNGRVSAADIADYLTRHQHLRAVSSHQLHPPFDIEGLLTLDPIVFLRHPLDRIRSAYEFERTQGVETPSALAASSMPFAEWIAFHNDRGSSQCSNFQVISLTSLRNAHGAPMVRAFSADEHAASARANLEALPAIGLVEHYDRSCAMLTEAWAGHHPGFRLAPRHDNTTRGGRGSLADRLEKLNRELGTDRYEALVADNQADLELWKWATSRLEAETP